MQEMHEIIEKQNSYIKSLESDINDIKARLSAANL